MLHCFNAALHENKTQKTRNMLNWEYIYKEYIGIGIVLLNKL